MHLAYPIPRQDATRVTFGWKDERGEHELGHLFAESAGTWEVPTGRNVQTLWVEYEPVAGE
jgi:hypothetical protein